METLTKINFKLPKHSSEETIFFGIPDTEKELTEMFALRYEIYAKHDYIYTEDYPTKLEIDELDRANKCRYIIAEHNNVIVGSARIIEDDPLPMERECFSFNTPKQIAVIATKNRIEIGRLVAKYQAISTNNYIPRHLIMIGILKSAFLFAKKIPAEGGYAFVKKRAFDKLKYLGFPIIKIADYTQKYRGRTLDKYFNQKDDPVYPTYFIEKQIDHYFNILFDRCMIFKKTGSTYYLQNINAYNLFLLKLYSLIIR
jgi:N-acyl-L-homoserine lactone synthetase